MAEIMVRVVVTAEPSEISLLWWLWYVKAGQGSNTVLSTTNGGQVSISMFMKDKLESSSFQLYYNKQRLLNVINYPGD